MYRFRRIDNLLGKHEELENQEIYFSDITSLNDPMEGLREYFWTGDVIVWRNFLKHYLLCLQSICMLAYLSKEEIFKPDDIPIFLEEEKLPTEQYKQMFQEICDWFFSSEGVDEYLKFLATIPYKIGRDELYVHLKTLHLLAFLIIMEIHAKYNFHPVLPFKHPTYLRPLRQFIKEWQKVSSVDEENQEKLKLIYSIQKELMEELDLISAYKLNDTSEDQRKRFILYEFPNAYLDEITRLTYPEGYVACFMEDCTNASIWGHYGDGHKGVCLKFRTTEKNGYPGIDLRCITGQRLSRETTYSEDIYNYRTFLFCKINYTNYFPSLDFFKSIGRLPINQLWRQWYTDADGNKSKCANHLEGKDNIEVWRKEHWNNHCKSYFAKLKDWEYEKEHRLLLSSGLDLYNTKEKRKLKYKFDDLEAIIFGMQTSVEDKVKIIKIIESKCKAYNRKDFDFYQADYSSSLGKMRVKKLALRF